MKIQALRKLPIRYKFVAIALLGMFIIAVTMGIADKISSTATENRFNTEQLAIQDSLWQRIIKAQFERLEIGTSTLRRQQGLARALSEQDYELVDEHAEQVFIRLLGADVLQDLQITNAAGKVVYRSDGIDYNGKSQMRVVQNALMEKKVGKDIEIGKDGALSSIVAFPLFSGGELVGTGVFIQNLQSAIEAFSSENQLDTFIATADGKLLHNTNLGTYEKLALTLTLPALGETSVARYKVDEQYHSVAVRAIKNKSNKAIAHLITARNITKNYISERNTQWLVYICITVVIILGAAILSYYIFCSLKPLNELLETVHKMRAGDTMARMDVQHDDEIGELGIAFNKMADEMVDNLHSEMISKQELEGRIELLHETVQKVGMAI